MKIKTVLAAMAAALAVFSWLAPAAYAAAPAALSYQATLRKNGALFNGTAAMEFRISGADGTIYWTSNSTDVVVTAGLFRYALGSPNEAQFAAVPWGDIAPYVQMKVDGGWLPREPLYSSAYSLHSYRAEGSSGTFTAYEGDIRISTTSGSKAIVFQDGSMQYRASGWTISGADAYTTAAGNAGVGVASPQARLDVQGAPAAEYAQIWRNEFGVIKASMTAAGMLYADGSLMRNMPTGADGLGTHTATRDLDVNGYNVVNVNTLSGYGQAVRVGSEVWMLNNRFGIGTNAPSAQLHISTSAGSSGDLLVISTGIAKVIRMNGAGAIYATKYYGDGSALIGVTGGGGAWNQTLTQNLMTGDYWISNDGSSKGLNLDVSGNVGVGQAAGAARLDVRGAVGNYTQLWRNSGGIIQASMTVIGTLYADGSQLRNLPAGGTATRALDMASFNINNVSTMTAGYLYSPGAGVVFTTNALVMGGRLGIDTQAPLEKLHVQGKILSSYLAGSGNRCVYADNTGVLRLSVDNCGLAGVNGDQLGLHVMSQNLNTNGNWISGDNNPNGLTVANTGNVGVGISGAATRLDVQSGADGYAQFWRNSGGTIVASMTSAGLLYADASKLRNLPLGADSLGSHTAAQALNMAGFQILNVASLTVTGASGAGASRLYLAQNAEISSTTAARYGGVYVSTHIYIAAGAKYYGDGSGLSGITGVADNLGSHTAAQDLNLASFNINNVSTMTAGYLSSPGPGVVFTTNALVMGGRLGIDTEAPQEKLHVNGYILSSPLAGGANHCVYVDANGVLRAKGSDCGTAAGAADDLGSHVMLQNLNTNGSWISGDNNPNGLTVANTGNVGVGRSGAGTRLDVQSGADGYAQFWRNSGGTIVASMTSAGLLYADGAGLRGAASDNLGNHTAAQNLDLASYNIVNVATMTAGFLTSSGPGVVFSTNILIGDGSLGINTYAPQESLHVNGNILSSNLSGPANRCVYVDMSGVLRAKGSDCGTAAGAADDLGSHIMTQNLAAGTSWISGDGNNEGIRIDVNGNVSVTDTTYSPGARLDVRGAVGNYIQIWRNAAGTVQSSMSVTGVLYGDGSGLRNLPSTADNMGNQVMTKNLSAAFYWISADGDDEGVFVDAIGNVGVGQKPASTRLDIKPANLDIYSQIWRNSGGTIVASMTASGLLYADASKLRSIPSSADSLGSHIATTTLQMADFDIKNAGAITANRQITSYSSVTVAGAAGLGAAKLLLSPGVEISSAPAEQQGGVYVSTNVYLAGGARYYGEGAALTALDASNVSAGTLNDLRLSANVPRLDADQSFAGVNTFASSLTVTSALGLGSARVRLNTNVDISSTSGANNGGVYISTHVRLAAGAKYYGDGSGLSNTADNMGNHIATATLNLAGNSIVNAASGTFTQGITASSFTASGTGLAAAQLRFNSAGGLVISSETSAALGAGVRVSTNIYIVGFSSAARYYGDASGMTGLPAGDNLGSHLAAAALDMGGNSIVNAASGTFAQGITASSFTASGTGLAAAQLRFNSAGGLVISSETSAALGAGVRVSTNIYIVGFSSAAGYYGDASGMIGLPAVNAALNMGGNNILNATAITASSVTASGIGLLAPQLKFKATAGNLVISSEASAALGAGVRVSTNVYIVGFSSATRYYGDGSLLTGIAVAGGVQKTGDTMTGQLTLSGSTLTINDADTDPTSSGLRFGNFSCTGNDKLTTDGSGRIICSADMTGGVGTNLSGVLASGNDADGFSIINLSSMSATGYITAARYLVNGSTMVAILSGADSIAYGVRAGASNGVVGNGNVFIGNYAGESNIFGSFNTATGLGALRSNTFGNGNTATGMDALGSNMTGGNNTANGWNALLANTIGAGNTAIGTDVLSSNSAGSANTANGWNALFSNTTGGSNTAIGASALVSNQTGSANSVVGVSAGAGGSGSFSSSTIMGYQAGSGLTTGSDNLLLGFKSGDALATGTRNIVIGYDQDASAPSASNELNIGGVLYGNLSAKTIGISTRVPQAALDIVSTGTAANIYVQIWRNGLGGIVSSMTSTGVLYPQAVAAGGSNISGVLTAGNNAGNLDIINLGAVTANGQLTTYSSATVASALGIGAVRFSLNPNVDISSAMASNYGGVFISTNVFLPSGAKYYGDGSSLSNIGAGTLVQRTGDTMTGQLTLNGSTLTIVDSGGGSGLRFGNYACTNGDKLTADSTGKIVCATDVSGGGGANINEVLTAGNNAGNLGIINLGALTVNGQMTTYSSATVHGNIKNLPLAGTGNRCVFADGSGMLGVKTEDCGTGVGGGAETCVNPNDANDILIQVGDFCVDQYEASVWSTVTGGTQYGAGVNYPCSDTGQDCATAGPKKIFARSVPGVVPSSSMTWVQASVACANSGKHLITNAEWQAAVTGTPDPGAGSSAPNCNTNTVAGVPTTTNAGTNCRSVYNIENMVGSLWEWVAEWGVYSPAQTFWNPTFYGDLAGGPSGAPIAGMIRGGAYDSGGPVAGPFSFNTSIPPNASDFTIGFRCAMRLR